MRVKRKDARKHFTTSKNSDTHSIVEDWRNWGKLKLNEAEKGKNWECAEAL